jgi:hypothetical protein
VIPASIETSAPSQTAQGVPPKPTTILSATSTPGTPQIVKGPQHGLALPADLRHGPQICQASRPSQDPSPAIISHAGGPATLLGPPAPQIISSPPRPPVILPGAGWPLRSILEVPDKPEGEAQVRSGSASAAAPNYGFQSVARPESLPRASVTTPPVPLLPSAGPVATLRKPASVPLPPVHIEMPAMKPGLPYETIGVMTFGDDYPSPAASPRQR